MKNSAITIDAEILGGTPVFRGTRVPVQSLFDWLETETLEEFLENFPSVTKDQALEVIGKDGTIIHCALYIMQNSKISPSGYASRSLYGYAVVGITFFIFFIVFARHFKIICR